MGKLKGTALLVIAGITLYLLILFLQPIWQYVWLLYITRYYPIITLKFLGYILLGIAVGCVLWYVYEAKITTKKNPIRQSVLLIAIVLLLIASMPLVWPEWFYSYWSF